ncbi:MAG: hydroxyacid dehydrogenase [Nanoarchaeota archaeon]|nr:hydroxyacid dehydrogenase [Nanoarchaeota archaeon]
MNNKKIGFFEVKEEYEVNIIKQAFPNSKIYSETLQEVIDTKGEEEVKEFNILSIFIYSKANKEYLSKCENVQFVITRSMGKNHIDNQYCDKKGIQIGSVSKYGENTVAEFTFALLLAISRKIIKSVSRVKRGDFDFTNLQGFDLQGKTIGLIGFGNIGQKFAQMCRGFEMNVIAYDAFAHNMQDRAKELEVTFVDLDELYTKSDIISLHVPLLPQTHHIVNKESISKMKEGVLLLNTSRGELLDTQAVLEGLNSGHIGYVGLDVIEGECMMKEEHQLTKEVEESLTNSSSSICDMKTLIRDHLLINHKNAFITPHNAFNTRDAIKRILDSTIEQIREFNLK